MPIVSPPPDAIIWTDVCKINVWAKEVKLPETKAELGEEEKSTKQANSVVNGSRRLLGSKYKLGKYKPRRRRTKSNWDPKTVKAVRLCPFDLCPAMEHGAGKVCVGTDLNHAVLGFAVC